MTDVSRMGGLFVFKGLTQEQVETVVKLGRPKKIRLGEPVLREGDSGESMFILDEGEVEITRRLGLTTDDSVGPQHRKRLIHLAAPQIFGEMGLLEDAGRSATVTAVTDCTVLEVTREDFQKLVDANPKLGYQIVLNMAVVLSGRVRHVNADVMKLTAALSLSLGNR